MTDDPPCARPWPTPAAAGRCSPASPARRSPPPRTATATPPPTPSRSPPGSAAAPTATWPSPPAPPAPTSWTSTSTARPATGSPRSIRLRDAGLLDGAAAYVRTPSGGMHAYFTGTHQRSGHLPAHHLDFLATGGYVLAPPSSRRRQALPDLVGTRRPRRPELGHASPGSCNPSRAAPAADRPARHPVRDLGHLARWVAAQPEGNRNAGLFWAANRALEADPAADLSPLADAARQAGLADPEITRTLDSARRTAQPEPRLPARSR